MTDGEDWDGLTCGDGSGGFGIGPALILSTRTLLIPPFYGVRHPEQSGRATKSGAKS